MHDMGWLIHAYAYTHDQKDECNNVQVQAEEEYAWINYQHNIDDAHGDYDCANDIVEY